MSLEEHETAFCSVREILACQPKPMVCFVDWDMYLSLDRNFSFSLILCQQIPGLVLSEAGTVFSVNAA